MKNILGIPLIFITIAGFIVSCSLIREEISESSQCPVQENIENAQTIGDVLIGRYDVFLEWEEYIHLGYLNLYPDGSYCFEKDPEVDSTTLDGWESDLPFTAKTRGQYDVVLENELTLNTNIHDIPPYRYGFSKIRIPQSDYLAMQGVYFIGISNDPPFIRFCATWSTLEIWRIRKPINP